MDKTEWIKRRAEQLWEAEGRVPEREQDCWDKAVQEFEAGSSEGQRGPVAPDPEVEPGRSTRASTSNPEGSG